MKTLLLATSVLLLVLGASGLRAAESSASFSYVVKDSDLAAVMAADKERVAASIAKDRARLEAVHSDELRYTHSSGIIDTKASFIDSIMEGRSVYRSYDYQSHGFKAIAPGIVLMFGRALISSQNDSGPVVNDINFLSVWREEHGRWKFLAWQAARNAPPAPVVP